jgi:hypothetical protein
MLVTTIGPPDSADRPWSRQPNADVFGPIGRTYAGGCVLHSHLELPAVQ